MDALGWEAVPEGKEALEGVKSAAEIAQYEARTFRRAWLRHAWLSLAAALRRPALTRCC